MSNLVRRIYVLACLPFEIPFLVTSFPILTFYILKGILSYLCMHICFRMQRRKGQFASSKPSQMESIFWSPPDASVPVEQPETMWVGIKLSRSPVKPLSNTCSDDLLGTEYFLTFLCFSFRGVPLNFYFLSSEAHFRWYCAWFPYVIWLYNPYMIWQVHTLRHQFKVHSYDASWTPWP